MVMALVEANLNMLYEDEVRGWVQRCIDISLILMIEGYFDAVTDCVL